MQRKFDRLLPPDWRHYERYPLTTVPDRPSPVVIGINWYENFDRPEQDSHGHWWIGRYTDLGGIRGGHCVALRPNHATDSTAWWSFYDQGYEGACVGFGVSRMMTLLNRHRYDARWLYREAQKYDEWPGESYEGTSVRAGLDVVRDQGHRRVHGDHSQPTSRDDGIREFRWATDVTDVLQTLGTPELDYVTLLNSWGRSGYPHFVRMPAVTLDILRLQDGEIGVVTDR